MKKIITGIVLLGYYGVTVGTNTVPSSTTLQPLRITLNSDQTQLLAKLKNQVQSYLASAQMSTLQTLGNFIRTDILTQIKNLYNTVTKELDQAQKRDVSIAARSRHRESLAILLQFFSEVSDALQPLRDTYALHAKNRALKKQQDASQKTSNGMFQHEEAYYALQRNISLPLQECKEIVDKATNTALIKLLEYLN